MSKIANLLLLVWSATLLVQAETLPSTDAKDLTAVIPVQRVGDSDLDQPTDLLREVTVTASLGRRRRASETTTSVYVIGSQEIARKQARQLGEALRGVPGVVSNLWGAGEDVHSTYFIRGLPTTSTALLVDGRSINNLNQEHVDLAELPVFDIDRVEVLKGGAGSVLYGSTAVGGAINVITRRPPKTFELGTKITYGSYGLSNYSFKVGGPLSEHFRYDLFATTSNGNNDYTYQVSRDPRTLFGETYPATTLTGIHPGGEANSTSIGANFDWELDPRTTLSNSTYWRKGLRGVNLFSIKDPRTAIATSGGTGCVADPICTANELGLNDENRPRIRLEYFGTGFTLDHKLGDNSNLQLRLGYDTGFTTESEVNGDGVITEDSSTNLSILNARILHDWQMSPGFNLSYGLDYIRESGRSFTLDRLEPGALQQIAYTATVDRPALFAVGTLKLADNLTATLGLRETLANTFRFTSATFLANENTRSYPGSLDPSIGLVWQVAPTLTLRSSWARVYHAPNFNDLFANGEIQGNPNLQAESGSTFDLGLDWLPTPTTTLRLGYFLNDIQNLLSYNRINPLQNGTLDPNDQALINQGYALGDLVRTNYPSYCASGLELSFNWQVAQGWNFFATETYTDARINQGFKSELDGSQYPLVPYHSGELGIAYTSPGDWRVALTGNFQGQRPSDPYHIGPGVGITPNGDFASTPSGNLVANLGALPPGSLLPGYLALDLSFHIPLNSQVALNGLVNNLTNLAYERNYGNGAPPLNFILGIEVNF